MPVQGSRFRQAVLEHHAHAVALLHLNCRPGTTTVVAPRVDGLERRDFSLHRLTQKMKYLSAAVQFVRQIRHVRRHHGRRMIAYDGVYRRRVGPVAPVRRVMPPILILARCLECTVRCAGAQRLAQPEQPCSERRRALKKSSSCAAHLGLLNFLVLQSAFFADKKLGTVSSFDTREINLVGKAGNASRLSRGGPALSFSGGTAQIRRTPEGASTRLLKNSRGRPK